MAGQNSTGAGKNQQQLATTVINNIEKKNLVKILKQKNIDAPSEKSLNHCAG